MTAVLPSADEPAVAEAALHARRRRTFAVISHPDAGKSTLTEALALHARVIQEAGAIHGKAGRKSTVSDWMDMEKARGISISSAALQFGYGDAVVNLLDTPGHADFSEDTYRVLAAVDSRRDAARRRQGPRAADDEAVRRLPAPRHPGAHGRQQVGPPRPRGAAAHGRDPRAHRPRADAADLAGRHRGRLPRGARPLDRRLRPLHPYGRRRDDRARGATSRPRRPPPQEGEAWSTAVEESELLERDGPGARPVDASWPA